MVARKMCLVALLAVVVAFPVVSRAALINYQGKLTDSGGQPVNATVSMRFSIYDSPEGGSQLWYEIQSSVVVANGIYSVLLGNSEPIPDEVFTVSDRWLGIKIGSDPEMMPRQRIASVAYAVNADMVDGKHASQLGGSGGGDGYSLDAADGNPTDVVYVNNDGNVGIGKTNPTCKLDVAGTIKGFSSSSCGLWGETAGSSGNAVYGKASASGNATNYGGWFESGGDLGAGIFAKTSGTSAWGVVGTATATGDVTNYGGWFSSAGNDGRAVYGTATATGNVEHCRNYGGYFEAAGQGGVGVYGISTGGGNYDVLPIGVYGEATSPGGYAVYSQGNEFVNGTVYVQGGSVAIRTLHPDRPLTILGQGTSSEWISLKDNSGITQWHINHRYGGLNFVETDVAEGRLFIQENGKVGIGTTNPTEKLDVEGDVALASILTFKEASAYSSAVIALDAGTGKKLSFINNDETGLLMVLEGATGNVGIGTPTPATRLHVDGNDNDGSTAALKVTSGTQNMLIDGNEIDSDDKLWLNCNSNNNVVCPTLELTGGSDIAEPFDINGPEPVEPGMVLVIDPDNPGKLKLSHQAYDRCVAGIVSGAGDIQTGMVMGQSGTVADGAYPVALTGRVYCFADASNGSIQPGDLLTTSDIPGHAMKVLDHQRAQGAVIGKAMSSLDGGRGLVFVLVTLQ